MESKFYSIAELATILRLHPKTILRFIHKGDIKARKIGRSWMVAEKDLKEYVHGELSGNAQEDEKGSESALSSRISVSAVIEIEEQDSKEASRISNTIMALLNGRDASEGKIRFDSLYYPEIRKSKYVIYGPPGLVSRLLASFEVLCTQE